MKPARPSASENYLEQVAVIAKRGTCARRKVGCVLVDKYGQVLATGYNGPASGEPHCITHPCPGADLPSGTGLSICEAVHAEANALLQCPDKRAIEKAYVSCSPCRDCVKLLMNTGCTWIIFTEPYAHDEEAKKLWTGGRKERYWVGYSGKD